MRAGGGDLVLKAFDSLGGSPREAIAAALRYRTPEAWIRAQATHSAMVGAGTALVPGLHLVLLGVDLGLVMRKIAATTWGVGRLLHAPVEPKQDLAMVLAIWTGTIDDDVLAAAEQEARTGVVHGGRILVGPGVFTASLLAAVSGEPVTSVLGHARPVVGVGAGALLAKAAEHHAMTTISSKVAAKITAAGAGRLVPVVGAAVAAAVNGAIVRSAGRAAVRYYTSKAGAGG